MTIYTTEHGKTNDIPSKKLKGLTLNTLKGISAFRKEKEGVLEFRKKAFDVWETTKEPHWSFDYTIDYKNIYPFSQPDGSIESKERVEKVLQRLNIDIKEQKRIKNIALDFVLDSVSLSTMDMELYNEYGIIFCSLGEALEKFSDLVMQYLNTVVPINDNYFASLNSAFFSDGTFVYVPKEVHCPVDISSYFRLDSLFASQFERTLIIAEEGSFLNYLEGCSAPVSKNNQLHSAVVEIIIKKNAVVNYHTLQNWYAGNEKGEGGIYNFVTKRGICHEGAELNWTQVELGSSFTWKYPSTVLLGDNSKTTFFSLAYTQNKMLTDTGTKAIHLGKNTKSYIVSKSIVDGESKNTFRFKIKVSPNATNSSSTSICDSLIKSSTSQSFSLPHFEINSSDFKNKHEAKTYKIDAEILFWLKTKGFDSLQSDKLLLSVFSFDIISKLPDEFYSEVFGLLEMKIEGNG